MSTSSLEREIKLPGLGTVTGLQLHDVVTGRDSELAIDGLFIAIGGIVTYNVFVTRVDNFNYMMDEASYEAVQLLSSTTHTQK